MPSSFKAPRHAWDSLTVQPFSTPFSCLLRFLFLPKFDFDRTLQSVLAEAGELLLVFDHRGALGAVAIQMDGVKRALGGAQAAADALVGVDDRGTAAQAASGLGAHLLLGKGLDVLAKGRSFSRSRSTRATSRLALS